MVVTVREGDTTAYSRTWAEWWAAGEAFALVEQDIELHGTVLSQFRRCAEPWCVFPYNGPGYGGAGGDPVLYGALGCVRFSAALLAAEPDLPAYVGAIDDAPGLARGDWRRLDARVLSALRDRGYAPHCHQPPVFQHHCFHGLCSCGYDHEAYPVDREGRYAPEG